jgi:manganese/zinc/iron transport system substrate-binding protein
MDGTLRLPLCYSLLRHGAGMLLMLVFVFGGVPVRDAHAEDACAEPELNVVATVGMIADVARSIGGSCVQVTALMGPGVDPHLYSATERDVEVLFDAEIIFFGGLHLEARLIDVFEQIENGLGKPVVAVSDSIPVERLLSQSDTDVPDPHVWMDVRLWMVVAETIRDHLIEMLPDRAEYIAANAEAYLAEMDALDVYVREQIARIPETQRVLVTAHDAFQYFGRAYDIEVFAPQGITTQAEVGVQDIRRTIELLVQRGIPAIFVESSVSPDVVEAIVAGARARDHQVVIGGSLFSDAMGAEGTPEGSYLGMIRANTDVITAGLTGEPLDR